MKKTQVQVKCVSIRRTEWGAFPFEANFRPVTEPRGKGLPRTRIVVQSNFEPEYSPGSFYTIEVKPAKAPKVG